MKVIKHVLKLLSEAENNCLNVVFFSGVDDAPFLNMKQISRKKQLNFLAVRFFFFIKAVIAKKKEKKNNETIEPRVVVVVELFF